MNVFARLAHIQPAPICGCTYQVRPHPFLQRRRAAALHTHALRLPALRQWGPSKPVPVLEVAADKHGSLLRQTRPRLPLQQHIWDLSLACTCALRGVCYACAAVEWLPTCTQSCGPGYRLSHYMCLHWSCMETRFSCSKAWLTSADVAAGTKLVGDQPVVLLQPLQLLQLPAAMPPTKAQIRQDLGQGNSGTISCCQSQPRTAVLTCKAKQYWRAASWQSSHSMGTPPSWASGQQGPTAIYDAVVGQVWAHLPNM